MQSDPSEQQHGGQRVPQLLRGGEGRGPLEHGGLRGAAHTDQEQHRQWEEDGDAYSTLETITGQ